MKSSFMRMKRVTDPFDENAKARIVGVDMTRPDYVSSGSDHSAEADDDDVTSSSLSALFFGCDAVESAAEDCDGADAELDRAMCDSISESVDLIGRIVENEADLFRNQLRVQVGRAAEIFDCLRSNKQMMRRNVMAYLRNCGYNAAVCKTNWPSSGGLSGGSYEFIDVDSSAVRMRSRYVVDLDFAAEFAIARPTSSYECLLRRLPRIYVGTAEEMRQILRAASSAARCSLKSGGLILPPWRKHRFMQCKWLGPYRRTTNLFPSPAAENRVKCRAVGFDAAANGGLLVFPAAGRTR